MLAAQFIAWNASDILLMIGGICLFIIFIVAAFFSIGSKYGPVPFIGFALFFLIALTIVTPHDRTVNGRHYKQVFVDLPAEYGNSLKVVDNSPRDHWVDFRLKACGGKTRRYDITLIRGHYYFAKTVVKKDKQGDDSTSYRPIARKNLPAICQTATLVNY